MNIPRAGTLARDILEFLFDVEAATLDEVCAQLPGTYKRNIVAAALARNRGTSGQITKKDGKWQLSAPGRVQIDKSRNPAPEVVPARTFVVNRPLSPQHFLKTTANRHDATMPTATSYLVSGTSREPLIRGN